MGGRLKQRIEPVAPGSRLEWLDQIRGFALLGILTVNMAHFSSPRLYWDLAGVQGWAGWGDRAAAAFISLFFEQKFLSIFAFLLGLGMAMQAARIAARGGRPAGPLFRRYASLLVLGLLHGVFIWMGDVLAAYALFGLAGLIFLRVRPRALRIWAGALVCVYAALPLLAGMIHSGAEEALAGQRAFFAEFAQRVQLIYSSGGFAEITAQRIFDFTLVMSHGLTAYLLPFAMFLLGMHAGRTGAPERLGELAPRICRFVRFGLPAGLLAGAPYALLELLGAQLHDLTQPLAALAVTGQMAGAPVLALAYMGAFVLLAQRPPWRRRLAPFGPVGRAALSNYFAQSLIATTLFYGYGFGLYGRMGPAAGLLLTAAIFGLQLGWSPLWFSRFRYGPLEWAWRSVTYGRLQPMRTGEAPRGAAGSAGRV